MESTHSCRRDDKRDDKIPNTVLVLAVLVFILFWLPPLWLWLQGPKGLLALKMIKFQQTHAALSLSFMAAIHWGFELASRPSVQVLLTSFWVVALAFIYLQMSNSRLSMYLLAANHFILCLLDFSRQKKQVLMPVWYCRLRFPLTLGIMAALLMTAYQ